MKVGIDARMIKNSGIGTYIRNLLSQYSEQHHRHTFQLFGKEEDLHMFNNKNDFYISSFNAKIYSLKEQFQFYKQLKGIKLGIFHSPHYNIPVTYQEPLVVTIHDIIHILFPQYLTFKAAKYYASFMIRKALTKSQRIITVSHNTKNDLINYFKVPEQKVSVIYNGVDSVFSPGNHLDSLELVKKAFGVKKNYVLYVGNVRPHKNITRMIRAFKVVKERGCGEFQLLLTGGIDDRYTEVTQILNDLKLNEDVVFTGSVKISDLVHLYRGASLFCFPSLYEGFGIPPIEAMACGVPVVSSQAASLPEVVGDAGILFDPLDTEAMAEAMIKVLDDQQLCRCLIKKGYTQATKFSWSETAQQTLRVYEEICNY